jgi:DNA gyrase subunit A
MYDIPEGRRATKGKSIMNYISLTDSEQVTSVLAMPKSIKGSSLSTIMVTAQGVSKKVAAKSFEDVRRSGIIAIRLDKGDSLVSAQFVEKGDTVTLVSAKGQSIRFDEKQVREMGRTAGGVRGLKLGKGDYVIGANVAKKGVKAELLVLSSLGYGKKTELNEYKVQGRGGSGIKTANVTPKTGQLMDARIVGDNESELIVISKKGQVIRTELSQIPTLGRSTQGVRIMKLREGDSIAALVCF